MTPPTPDNEIISAVMFLAGLVGVVSSLLILRNAEKILDSAQVVIARCPQCHETERLAEQCNAAAADLVMSTTELKDQTEVRDAVMVSVGLRRAVAIIRGERPIT